MLSSKINMRHSKNCANGKCVKCVSSVNGKCFCFNKNRFHRYDINRTRPGHGYDHT